MYRPSPVLLCAVVIVLMMTAGCTFLNPRNTGANPLVTTTPAPVSSTVPPAATTQPGAAGTPASGTCPADTSSDTSNCGGCGFACPANALCQAGQCYCKDGYTADTSNQCVPAPAVTGTDNGCPAGMSPCPDGNCYDLSANPADCGICGNMCPAGMVCSGSTCTNVPADTTTAAVVTTTTSIGPGLTKVVPGGLQLSCPAIGLVNCGGSCIDPATNNGNCGSCGNICSGLSATCCGGTCVNLKTSAANCGSCGHKCNAFSTCTGGSCTVTVVTRISLAPTLKIAPTLNRQLPGYQIPVGP